MEQANLQKKWDYSTGPGESINESLLTRLQKPRGVVDVVIDTDTYNEIDDQFALAFLIKSDEKYCLKGIYAAPFFNQNSISPADGMEKSYNEIFNILSLMERDDLKTIVKRGSERYLPNENEYIVSQAAESLVCLAMKYTPERPLYIISIGAITNIASAILMQPRIIDRIVIVWLGGNAIHWTDNNEFNISQDIAAARIIFGCGAALVHLPCMGVVSSFTVSGPELEYWLRGKNKLCDYLVDVTTKAAVTENKQALSQTGESSPSSSRISAWTRVIWDVTAAGWLLDGDFMRDRLEHSPIPQYGNHYSFDQRRHLYRYVYHINRDNLFRELIYKLTK